VSAAGKFVGLTYLSASLAIALLTGKRDKLLLFPHFFPYKHKTPHSFEKRGFNNLFTAPPLQKGLRLVVNLLTMSYSNMPFLVLLIP
jgi:hypothetical protein